MADPVVQSNVIEILALVVAAASFCVAAVSFVWSLWTGRKAGEAALVAKNADARAEEAVATAKRALALLDEAGERDKQKLAIERAKLDAGQIAERWKIEIAEKAKGGRGPLAGNHFSAHFPVNTEAERHAVEIIRGEKDKLWITTVDLSLAAKKVAFAGWTITGRQRLKPKP